MPAYVLVEVLIDNPEEYEQYKKLTPASIEAYDGKFLVRGGAAEVLEGVWNPGRIVVLQFPSVERAKEWWHSPEYAPAKKIRHQTATTKMLLVQGYV